MSAAVDAEVYAAALAALPSMSRGRLAALLRAHSPEDAWQVVSGRLRPAGLVAELVSATDAGAAWRRAADDDALAQMQQRLGDSRIEVVLLGSAHYPAVLAHDPTAPPVLFTRGRLAALDGRRVALVGTRNATAAGRATATRLADQLATAGVHVVSGLARGIDGCAHRGMLSSSGSGVPIGVVGSGLDVPYPREHAELWERVADAGLLLSEAPPGAAPEAWRFPQRNRIIAAVAEVVVVVESRESGGSLITVDEALERGRPVMAVPGALASRASAGTNRLLRDGAAVVLDVGDVLTALAIDHVPLAVGAAGLRARPPAGDRDVYEICAAGSASLDTVVLATSRTVGDAAMALARLVAGGWLAEVDGWFECTGAPR